MKWRYWQCYKLISPLGRKIGFICVEIRTTWHHISSISSCIIITSPLWSQLHLPKHTLCSQCTGLVHTPKHGPLAPHVVFLPQELLFCHCAKYRAPSSLFPKPAWKLLSLWNNVQQRLRAWTWDTPPGLTRHNSLCYMLLLSSLIRSACHMFT